MKKVISCALLVILIQGCRKTDEDFTYSVDTTAEAAQQVGDVAAAVDESGGQQTGAYSMNSELESIKKIYARLSGDRLSDNDVAQFIIPKAQANACSQTTFGGCTANKRIRDFGGCLIGTSGAINGTVTLTFAGPDAGTCGMGTTGDNVARVPAFTITGLRGASFSVSAPTTGQVVTRAAGLASTFENSGIRRTFTTPKGSTILDVTTTTGSAINVTGTTRTGRTMSGGSLIVTNNLTSEACTLVPTGVTWAGGCNCPTSGNFDGTCTGGKTFKVTFGGTCGTVTVDTTDETGKIVVLDRCGT
jgi:hypothetical protein